MKNAKDTFYIVLRDRLAAINPARTVVIRGITRPGVVVEENELATSQTLEDIFRLRWTALKVDVPAPLPLATLTCEIHYVTAGTQASGGIDRGRLLAQMDAELLAAVRTVPHYAPKMNYTEGTPSAMATNIFWSDPVYEAATEDSELLERMATVQIFSYQEVGE